MKLGKLAKKHGSRQDAVVGTGLVVVEWYASLGELVDGLMKNAFAGAEYSLLAVAGSTAGLLFVNAWPFAAVFVTEGAVRALYAATLLLIVLIFWVANRTCMHYVIACPAAAVLFTYIMWRRSALCAVTSGTVTWRGTEYPLEVMRTNKV